jgi:hypothetical protein
LQVFLRFMEKWRKGAEVPKSRDSARRQGGQAEGVSHSIV